MSENISYKFFISIVLPSMLAILLFGISLYMVIIPSVERNIMEEKKVMLSELTNTVWSLLEEYANESAKGRLSRDEAQQLALGRVAEIRYGEERKDYFWIIDETPRMLMHPYRPELINSDLDDYKDANGKKLFVEATKVVKEKGHGFIDYMWQWKDDSTQIVPKLSYVMEFKPWGWIVGTGIYLDDVAADIKMMQTRMLRISLFIIAVITIIILFVIRQSKLIENNRKQLTSELMLSREKYKSLVGASTEGTLMFLDEAIIFSNLKFSTLSGYEIHEVYGKKLEDILVTSWDEINRNLQNPDRTLTIETRLACADGSRKDVLLSISKVKYSGKDGFIIVVKEISQRTLIARQTEKLAGELQTSLMLMKQPIRHLITDMLTCDSDFTIQQTAELMSRKQKPAIVVKDHGEYIGIVTDSDYKNRVLAANRSPGGRITQIMTSPIVTLPEKALLYEALLLFNSCKLSHLVTRNENGTYTGTIRYRDVTAMQQNTVSFFMKETALAESVDALAKIHDRVPVLVNALIESGDKTANITRVITSISDAVTKRIIELGIEKMGPPPCRFAFMVMGSEGRMEQTLSTDQDNAIVFEDLPEEKLDTAANYFMALGDYICDALNRVGYRLCRSAMMASNPEWNQPWSVWKGYFDHWIDTSDIRSIVESSIFFDIRGVYGDVSLVGALRQSVLESLRGRKLFFNRLAQSVGNYKSPVSMFGNIVGNEIGAKNKTVDIKQILMPVIKFSRLYTLYHGFDETNTLERITRLYREAVISKALYEELSLSYNYLMQLRFRVQATALLNGREPINKIDTTQLTQIEIGTLKKIFSEVNNIPSRVNHDFKL